MSGMMQKIMELNDGLFGASGEQVYNQSYAKAGPLLCSRSLVVVFRA
jgi:hypothetical protein